MAYRDNVLTLSPYAFWELDDSSSPISDSGSGGNTRTGFGSPTYNAGALARIGDSIGFNGTDAYFGDSDLSLKGAGNIITVCAIVIFDDLSGERAIICDGGFLKGWQFSLLNGNLGIYVRNNSVLESVEYSTTNLIVGEIYHIAAVIDGPGTALRLYVNGVEVAANASTGAMNDFDGTNGTTIGSCNDSSPASGIDYGVTSGFFGGKMAMLSVHRSVLSEANIVELSRLVTAGLLESSAILSIQSSAELTTAIQMSGDTSIIIDLSGLLDPLWFFGNTALNLESSGDLTTNIHLSGDIQLKASADGALTTAIHFDGDANLLITIGGLLDPPWFDGDTVLVITAAGTITFPTVAAPKAGFTPVYRLTITDPLSGLPDLVTQRIANFQARTRSGTNSYLTVTIPGVDLIGQITGLAAGEFYVEAWLRYADGTTTAAQEIARANVDEANTFEGGASASIVLTGYKQTTYSSPQVVQVDKAITKSLQSGVNRWRIPPTLNLRPLDTLEYQSERIIARQIVYTVGTRQSFMDVSDATG